MTIRETICEMNRLMDTAGVPDPIGAEDATLFNLHLALSQRAYPKLDEVRQIAPVPEHATRDELRNRLDRLCKAITKTELPR